MTSLLIIVIVALLGIAVWQLTKIFDLTQSKHQLGEEYRSEVATDKDNSINGYLMFGFLAFIYILTIYCCVKWGYMPLLDNAASEHGKDVEDRKSTRLNSSHVRISYAVFCLKKKKNKI